MTDTTNTDAASADSPLSASAALKLLDNQQRRVANERGRFVFPITLGWTVAWLIGFLALWSIDGPVADHIGNGRGLPLPAALTIFLVLLVAAIVISIVQGVRGGRGFKGSASAFTGTVYGISWSVAMIAIGVLGGALQANGMSTTVGNIYYPCVYTFAVGLLYLMAGAIWRSVSSVVAGGCVILVAVVAAWFGYPNHYLVLAIGGGGTFLVLAIHDVVAGRRVRAQIAGAAQRG
jgi:hypothetical protein